MLVVVGNYGNFDNYGNFGNYGELGLVRGSVVPVMIGYASGYPLVSVYKKLWKDPPCY